MFPSRSTRTVKIFHDIEGMWISPNEIVTLQCFPVSKFIHGMIMQYEIFIR